MNAAALGVPTERVGALSYSGTDHASAAPPPPVRPSLPGIGGAARRANAVHAAGGWPDAPAGGVGGVPGPPNSPGVSASGNSFIMSRRGCLVAVPCDQQHF